MLVIISLVEPLVWPGPCAGPGKEAESAFLEASCYYKQVGQEDQRRPLMCIGEKREKMKCPIVDCLTACGEGGLFHHVPYVPTHIPEQNPTSGGILSKDMMCHL